MNLNQKTLVDQDTLEAEARALYGTTYASVRATLAGNKALHESEKHTEASRAAADAFRSYRAEFEEGYDASKDEVEPLPKRR